MHLIFQSTILIQVFFRGMSQMMQPMQLPMHYGMPPMQGPMPPMPGAMPQMPGAMPPGMMGGPMHMPMPMPMGMPQAKLPVVVMPFYKNNKKEPRRYKKRRRPRRPVTYDESASYQIDADDSLEFRRSNGRRRQVLTPVVSYVTKDGYVVYQKKIRKDKAKDWLRMGQDKSLEVVDDEDQYEGNGARRMTKKRSSY